MAQSRDDPNNLLHIAPLPLLTTLTSIACQTMPTWRDCATRTYAALQSLMTSNGSCFMSSDEWWATHGGVGESNTRCHATQVEWSQARAISVEDTCIPFERIERRTKAHDELYDQQGRSIAVSFASTPFALFDSGNESDDRITIVSVAPSAELLSHSSQHQQHHFCGVNSSPEFVEHRYAQGTTSLLLELLRPYTHSVALLGNSMSLQMALSSDPRQGPWSHVECLAATCGAVEIRMEMRHVVGGAVVEASVLSRGEGAPQGEWRLRRCNSFLPSSSSRGSVHQVIVTAAIAVTNVFRRVPVRWGSIIATIDQHSFARKNPSDWVALVSFLHMEALRHSLQRHDGALHSHGMEWCLLSASREGGSTAAHCSVSISSPPHDEVSSMLAWQYDAMHIVGELLCHSASMSNVARELLNHSARYCIIDLKSHNTGAEDHPHEENGMTSLSVVCCVLEGSLFESAMVHRWLLPDVFAFAVGKGEGTEVMGTNDPIVVAANAHRRHLVESAHHTLERRVPFVVLPMAMVVKLSDDKGLVALRSNNGAVVQKVLGYLTSTFKDNIRSETELARDVNALTEEEQHAPRVSSVAVAMSRERQGYHCVVSLPATVPLTHRHHHSFQNIFSHNLLTSSSSARGERFWGVRDEFPKKSIHTNLTGACDVIATSTCGSASSASQCEREIGALRSLPMAQRSLLSLINRKIEAKTDSATANVATGIHGKRRQKKRSLTITGYERLFADPLSHNQRAPPHGETTDAQQNGAQSSISNPATYAASATVVGRLHPSSKATTTAVELRPPPAVEPTDSSSAIRANVAMPHLSVAHLMAMQASSAVVSHCAGVATDTERAALRHEILHTMHIVGQWDSAFIVLCGEVKHHSERTNDEMPSSNQRRLMLCDQHALHERLRLEYFLMVPGSFCRPSPAQSSLRAGSHTVVPFSHHAIVAKHQSALMLFGWRLQLERSSTHSSPQLQVTQCPELRIEGFEYRVEAMEQLLKTAEECEAVGLTLPRPTSEGINEEWPIIPSPFLEIFVSRACRGAVMFGDALSDESVSSLIRCGIRNAWLFTQCAHGRPTLAEVNVMREFE